MTEHRPPACRYDRHRGERVTRDHRDDCPDPAGHRGCAPCTAPHCLVCGREHATNDHPHTCPTCVGLIRDDLADIRTAYAALTVEVLEGGGDGHLVAAAPIPGGTAAVLIGPTVRLDILRVSRGMNVTEMQQTHRTGDPLPALAVLAQWEDIYRAWLGHRRRTTTATLQRPGSAATITAPAGRATLGTAISYLRDQVPHLANHLDGTEPNWLAFVHQIRALRADAERVLHDEREHEEGVECFECGDRLVRRFRVAKRCRHTTAARVELQNWVTARNGAQDRLRTYATYPELEGPRTSDLVAAAAPPAQLLAAARRPCKACAVNPGGIDNPEPGQSWECPGCRKQYDPGEYATAVRRDLLENGSEGDGWTQIGMAAQAATTAVGVHVLDDTVRKWTLARVKPDGTVSGPKVTSCCVWQPGKQWGQQLVFWPDVADAAVDQLARARELEALRMRHADEARQFRAAAALAPADTDMVALGKGMGIHPARVRKLIDDIEHGADAGERLGA